MPWFLTLQKITLKCFVFFELSCTRIDWQPCLQRTLLGPSFKRSCQAFERPFWSNHPSTYICNRLPLLMSLQAPNLFQAWACDGQSTKPFHFPSQRKDCFFFFFLLSVISFQKHHNWIEHIPFECKRTMDLNVPSCLSRNIPSLVDSHSSDHYAEWADAPGLDCVVYACGHRAADLFLLRLDSFGGKHQLQKQVSSEARYMNSSAPGNIASVV